MKKLVSMLLLVALVVAACGSGSSVVAATVDGTDITVGEVDALLEVEGSTIPKDQFAQFLGFAVQWEVISVAAKEQYGIELTDEEVAADGPQRHPSLTAGPDDDRGVGPSQE